MKASEEPRLRRRVGASGAAAAAMVVLACGAVGAATMTSQGDLSGKPPPGLTEQRPGEFGARGAVVTTVAPDGATAREISTVMDGAVPRSTPLVGTTVQGDDGTDLTKFVSGTDAGGYEVTVYRHFAEDELKDLPRLEAENGTAWLGTDGEGVTSIYYRSADRTVGLRVAQLWSPSSRERFSPDRLVGLAGELVQMPAVRQEAQS